MGLPNLLVVGVAKSGTSSLHHYLSQHPEIFMSNPKEPRFLSSQTMNFPLGGPKDSKVEDWYVKNFEDYKALFDSVEDEKVVGESSADTFYFHKKTIPVIKEYLGQPKIIIILRNPVSRSFSAFQHLRRDDREHLEFSQALKKEPERIKENYELIYHYVAASMYSEGIDAFQKNFSEVKVILNEELQTNPQECLKEVFDFLSVDNSVEINTEIRHNLSGLPRSKFMHQVLFEGRDILGPLRPVVRFFIPSAKRKEISRKMMEKNLQRIQISADDKAKLKELFQEDIEKTAKILQRDLSIWK